MARKTKSKSIKKITIALFIIFAFGVIIVIGVYQNQPREKKLASEYFEITNAGFTDGEYKEPTSDKGGGANKSSILIVYGISCRLYAKGGDAHSVVVEGWGGADPILFEYILKDEYANVLQTSPHPKGIVLNRNEEGKFPFQVEIDSKEAKGTITIYFY